MSDRISPSARSRLMGKIRGRDTRPEMFVRRLVHGMGYRYRLHRPDLPGKPDLVFRSRKKAIFVHGCFWHRHDCAKGVSLPGTRTEFWRDKLEANRARDRLALESLRRLGWDVMVVWECEVKQAEESALKGRIRSFLEG